MPSHNFRAALLTAAALTSLATAAGAQGFISPGTQAISPPGRPAVPAAPPTATQALPAQTPPPLPGLRVPAARAIPEAAEAGAVPVLRAALPASQPVPQPRSCRWPRRSPGSGPPLRGLGAQPGTCRIPEKPVPAAQLGGKATARVSGTSQAIVLAPGDANSLTGKLPVAATGKTTTVLSLTVSGKTAQARFASAQ